MRRKHERACHSFCGINKDLTQNMKVSKELRTLTLIADYSAIMIEGRSWPGTEDFGELAR